MNIINFFSYKNLLCIKEPEICLVGKFCMQKPKYKETDEVIGKNIADVSF